jgi:hypothetical protein
MSVSSPFFFLSAQDTDVGAGDGETDGAEDCRDGAGVAPKTVAANTGCKVGAGVGDSVGPVIVGLRVGYSVGLNVGE